MARRAGYGRLAAAVATTVAIAAAPPAFAQNTVQLPLQFDFLPPGARSVGMGSAFIAGADDATAAFTNPAGLARLGRREISAELRFKRLETPFLFGGRITGAVTNIGLDTIPTPVYREDIDDQFGPAFISFLWPIGAKASVIGYRHEVATIENTYFSQGVFERAVELGVVDDRTRTTPVGGTRAVRIRNYGGSVGYKVSERLSVGGGLSLYQFDLEADFARFGVEGNFAGVPNLNLTTATATQRADDWTAGVNAGVLFDVAPRVKVGATYRRGPAFTFTQEDLAPSIGLDLLRVGKFKVPDVFGLGVEWRATDALRLVMDYDRVQYSQLKEDFIFFQSLISQRPERLLLDDGNEFHVGAEYPVSERANPTRPSRRVLARPRSHRPLRPLAGARRHRSAVHSHSARRLLAGPLHLRGRTGADPLAGNQRRGRPGRPDQVRNVFRCDPILGSFSLPLEQNRQGSRDFRQN